MAILLFFRLAGLGARIAHGLGAGFASASAFGRIGQAVFALALFVLSFDHRPGPAGLEPRRSENNIWRSSA